MKPLLFSRTGLAAAVLALPLAATGLAQGSPQVIGITSALVNQVSIAGVGAPQFRRAVLRERVALADRVQTGQRSQLQLMLLDKSVFSVGANARLTIDRFVYDPARGSAIGASVTKGAFRFLSGRRSDGSGSSIRTPVATIGIRGTIVEGVVGKDAVELAKLERGIPRGTRSDSETATLILLRGPGARTQGGLTVGAIDVTAGGTSVVLDRPLQATYVPRPGAAPIGPFTISPLVLDRLNALVFPALGERWGTAAKKPPKFRLGIGISGSPGGGEQPGEPGRPAPQPDRQPQYDRPSQDPAGRKP